MDIPEELRRKIRKLAGEEEEGPPDDWPGDDEPRPETLIIVLLVVNE